MVDKSETARQKPPEIFKIRSQAKTIQSLSRSQRVKNLSVHYIDFVTMFPDGLVWWCVIVLTVIISLVSAVLLAVYNIQLELRDSRNQRAEEQREARNVILELSRRQEASNVLIQQLQREVNYIPPAIPDADPPPPRHNINNNNQLIPHRPQARRQRLPRTTDTRYAEENSFRIEQTEDATYVVPTITKARRVTKQY